MSRSNGENTSNIFGSLFHLITEFCLVLLLSHEGKLEKSQNTPEEAYFTVKNICA